ncbi:MAG: hypothetical protein PHH08_01275 [Candidatus ainarchaeum sp.]|nr:hypothetical protein [Candidatus ainarchaeum sp.]
MAKADLKKISNKNFFFRAATAIFLLAAVFFSAAGASSWNPYCALTIYRDTYICDGAAAEEDALGNARILHDYACEGRYFQVYSENGKQKIRINDYYWNTYYSSNDITQVDPTESFKFENCPGPECALALDSSTYICDGAAAEEDALGNAKALHDHACGSAYEKLAIINGKAGIPISRSEWDNYYSSNDITQADPTESFRFENCEAPEPACGNQACETGETAAGCPRDCETGVFFAPENCWLFDSDLNSGVNNADEAVFNACGTNPENNVRGISCRRFDSDADGAIGALDYAKLSACIPNPNRPSASDAEGKIFAEKILKSLEEGVTGGAVPDPLFPSQGQKTGIQGFLHQASLADENTEFAVLNSQMYFFPASQLNPRIPLDRNLFSYRIAAGADANYYFLKTKNVSPYSEIFLLKKSTVAPECTMHYSGARPEIRSDLKCVFIQALASHPGSSRRINSNSFAQAGLVSYLAGQKTAGNILDYAFFQDSNGGTNYALVEIKFPGQEPRAYYETGFNETEYYGQAPDMEGIADRLNRQLKNHGAVIIDSAKGIDFGSDANTALEALKALAVPGGNPVQNAEKAVSIIEFDTVDLEGISGTTSQAVSKAPEPEISENAPVPDLPEYYGTMGSVPWGKYAVHFLLDTEKSSSALAKGTELKRLEKFGYSVRTISLSKNQRFFEVFMNAFNNKKNQIIAIDGHGTPAALPIEVYEYEETANVRAGQLNSQYPPHSWFFVSECESSLSDDLEITKPDWCIFLGGEFFSDSGRRKAILLSHMCYGGGVCVINAQGNDILSVPQDSRNEIDVGTADESFFLDFFLTEKPYPPAASPANQAAVLRTPQEIFSSVPTKYLSYEQWREWESFRPVSSVCFSRILLGGRVFCLMDRQGGSGPSAQVAPMVTGSINLSDDSCTLGGDFSFSFSPVWGTQNTPAQAIKIDARECMGKNESAQDIEARWRNNSELPEQASKDANVLHKFDFYPSFYPEEKFCYPSIGGVDVIPWNEPWGYCPQGGCECPFSQDMKPTEFHGQKISHRILTLTEWQDLSQDLRDKWQAFLKITVSGAESYPARIKMNGNGNAMNGWSNIGVYDAKNVYNAYSDTPYWSIFNGVNSPGGTFQVWYPCLPPTTWPDTDGDGDGDMFDQCPPPS